MITPQHIYEGKAPRMLYWTLPGGFDNYHQPSSADFHQVGDHRVFGVGGSRNECKPFASRSVPWLMIDYDNVKFSHTREQEVDLFRWETSKGTLTALRHSNHMTEFPVKTVDDIPLWHEVQRNLLYTKNPDFTEEESRAAWSLPWKWSPVQELLQFVTGVENFYYLLMDAPEQMRSMISAMHQKNLEALQIGFESCPNAVVLRLSENTSSQIISPDYYRELTLPHVKKYVDIAHERDMKCVVHMCGSLMALLDCFEETGMDGIHSVTPPPVGDTHYITARERFGDDFIIWGRLSAQLFINKSKQEILETLQEMIPERLIPTPFALMITTDEMQPAERDVYALVEALNDLNQQYS